MASVDMEVLRNENGDESATAGASEELGVMIEDLLSDLSGKFNNIAAEITAKMDDMSRRIDNLEASMQSQRSNVESNVVS